MFDLTKNYEISRKIAAEGMILLKNDEHTLPLKQQKVGIIGKECLDLIRGGGGSAHVKCAYVKSLLDGLLEKTKENKIDLCEESIKIASETECYTLEQLNMLSEKFNTAIVTIKRYSREGGDRREGPNYLEKGEIVENENDFQDYELEDGFFRPSKSEIDLFRKIEQSNIKNVVLILNLSATVDISYIEKFKKIKAVLLSYLPGMEAGRAIADVLCGDVNPSGKLVDTIAYKYEDYPSSNNFHKDPYITEYKEGVFIGYRYFETYAPQKVLYPFGFGLSYTEFEFSNYTYNIVNAQVQVGVDVKNIGEIAGKEVVQVYSSSPKGMLEKPSVELRGFAKTKKLEPGETEKITISFDIGSMASFDEEGVSGYKAAWVLEKGDYTISLGNSIRNTKVVGKYTVDKNTVIQQLSLRFDGSEYNSVVNPLFKGETQTSEKISLYDVYEGKSNIYDFIKQLSPEDLISLASGQQPAFPLGTAGIGNLKKFGVPNPQTADGPAGIRRSVNTTCFPCATLVASAWDKDLQYAMGKAMGEEGVSTGIDIWLAPAMNIHRDPLCGRNFEYFSEDPLITGKTATAIVNGAQSAGLCATIKHFIANNRENNRLENSSVINERTIREIYLKGFEIAIKECNPTFVMTTYNKLNGKYTAENAQLLKGVLRDEWGYEGGVMTDWSTYADFITELKAGNNIRMPFTIPSEVSRALECYNNGEITIENLRENAYYILKSVMKTNCFKKKDFGKRTVLKKDVTEISSIDLNGVSSTRVRQSKREDGTDYIYQLGRTPRDQRTIVYYVIDALEEGDYNISAEISTNCPQTQIWYYKGEEERMGTAFCDIAVDENKWYTVDAKIKLQKGENILKVVVATEPDTEYEYAMFKPLPKEDLKLAKLTITKQ